MASQVGALRLGILLRDHDQGRQNEAMAPSSMVAVVSAAVVAGSTAQPSTPTPSTTLRHPHDPDLRGKNPLSSPRLPAPQVYGRPPAHQRPTVHPQPKTPSEPSSATPHPPAPTHHPPPFPPQERSTVPTQPPHPHLCSAAAAAAAGIHQAPTPTATPSVPASSPPAAPAHRRGRSPLCLAPARDLRDLRGSFAARRGGPGWVLVVVGRM